MAENPQKREDPISGSPSSDFDPLIEENGCVRFENEWDEEQCDISPGSSLGQDSFTSLEPESFDKYAITPPVNSREMKRLAEKRRSHTVGSSNHHHQIAKRLQKINRHAGATVLDQLTDVSCETEVSSPDNEIFMPNLVMPKKIGSSKKDKNATKSRSFDRELKRRASDVGAMSLDMLQKPQLLNVSLNLKVDSPNRFMSLQSKPVSVTDHRKSPSQANIVFPKQEETVSNLQRRSTSYSSLDCPQERIEFHKTFSALINLHNNPEKKKKETESSPIQYARQLSSEMEMFQTQLIDIVWLELQARLRGHTIEEHDMYLYKIRSEIVPGVLNEILNFKVRLKSNTSEDEYPPLTPEFSLPKHEDSSSTIATDTPTGSTSNITALELSNLQLLGDRLSTVITEQKEALLQVTEVLRKMEVVESLYPTLKTLGKYHTEYYSDHFQNRLNTLLLWQNITKDIGNKLSLMANVLYVDAIPGIDWPWLDYESPSEVLKRIRDTSNTITPNNFVAKDNDKNLMQPHTKGELRSGEISSSSSSSSLTKQAKPRTSEIKITATVATYTNNPNTNGRINPGSLNLSRDERQQINENGSSKVGDSHSHNDGLSESNDGLDDTRSDRNDHENDGLSDAEIQNNQTNGLSKPENEIPVGNNGLSDHYDRKATPNDGLSDDESNQNGFNDGLSDDSEHENYYDGENSKKHNDGLSDDDTPERKHDDALSNDDNPQIRHNDGLSDDESPQNKHNDGLSDDDSPQIKHNDGLSDDESPQNKHNDGLSDDDSPQMNHNDGLSDNDSPQIKHNDGLSDDDSPQNKKRDCRSNDDGSRSINNGGLSDDNNHGSFHNDGLGDKDSNKNGHTNERIVSEESHGRKHGIKIYTANSPKCSASDVSKSSVSGVDSSGSTVADSSNIITPQKSNSLTHSTPNTSFRKLSNKNVHVHFASMDTSPTDSTGDLMGLSPADRSSPLKTYQAQRSISNVSSNMSRSDSTFSIDDNARTSIYRHFVEKHLKKMGLRKLMSRLKYLLHGTLLRAQQALEADVQDENLRFSEPVSPSDIHLGTSPSMDGEPSPFIQVLSESRKNLIEHGPHSDAFIEMNLPSFLPTYLFLLRIPLDVVHECLRLRLEQAQAVQDTEPSILTIRQLIRECKEVLINGLMVKQYYQQMFSSVLPNKDKDVIENDLHQYEEDFKQMLDVYFDYMRIYMSQLQTIYEMSKRLKNFLEDEWHFTKKVCPHVRGGEANAGKYFCVMASGLLGSIGDFLESNMDTCTTKLYDSMLLESMNDTDAMNEIRRHNSRSGEVRKGIANTCRTLKETFAEARERAAKALGFAKLLRKDLEIAADFNVQSTEDELFTKLLETSHVQVVVPHSTGYTMFVPQQLQQEEAHVIQLLNVSCGHDDSLQQAAQSEDGYLILVKCPECSENNHKKCAHWKGPKLKVQPTAETTIALSHIEVVSLFLVVINSSHLQQQRVEFSKLMGSTVQLVNEQTSCHQAISESLKDLRSSAMTLRENIAEAIKDVDQQLSVESLSDMEEVETINIQKLYRETLHQCYSFGFEYHKELIRLVSGETRVELAQHIVKFAVLWMEFVTDKCERGKGVKPRWAKPGFDFLCVACEPRVTACITEDEFTNLKTCMNKCIIHVIGERVHPTVSPGRPNSPLPERLQRNISCPQGFPRPSSRQTSTTSSSSSCGEPGTPLPPFPESPYERKASVPANLGRSKEHDVEILDGGDEGGIVLDIHQHREFFNCNPDDSIVLKNRRTKILKLEQERTNKLYAAKQIGRITQKQQQVEVYITNKKVNFKWQRGIKIGEGQFGKVYTAVNTDSGEMMAVKEIRFQQNDHKTIKDVAEEIKIFEELQHSGLVKYYGVEVHRDEMLIFMEYCANGTIEEVAKQGLSEAMVRKYTGEILQAVAYLHEHDIVHRDIKGANIFLTTDGPVKLGDFGCAVKLRNHTTMPGEVNSVAGTTAFMAPEVIKNEKTGAGRASDIWSVACVVIEMATGKRPWHELKNNFNIMYKVGTGGIPAIPDTLSHEGIEFLEKCLVHNPAERPTASDLLFYPFTKVVLDDVY